MDYLQMLTKDDIILDMNRFYSNNTPYFNYTCFGGDILKNNAFEKYPSDKTSPPLPITYTFKILGKSGLRRGDIFNIAGIPRKYAEHGFFQIINIEQNIQGSLWTTSITGQYRQNVKSVKK